MSNKKTEWTLKKQIISLLENKIKMCESNIKNLESKQLTVYDIKWSSKDLILNKRLFDWFENIMCRLVLVDDSDSEIKEELVVLYKSALSRSIGNLQSGSTNIFSTGISLAETEADLEVVTLLSSYLI